MISPANLSPIRAELDLFTIKQGRRLGFEFKYFDTPELTTSMYTALADLKSECLYIFTQETDKSICIKKIIGIGLNQLSDLKHLN